MRARPKDWVPERGAGKPYNPTAKKLTNAWRKHNKREQKNGACTYERGRRKMQGREEEVSHVTTPCARLQL